MNKIFIGRQAIYDQNRNVHGYELLYRDSDTTSANFSDGDKASSDVLLNTFLEIGFEQIVGPHKAFINMTRKFFVDMSPLPFESGTIVLELLEDVEVDDLLVKAVESYHQQGYQIAIDDYGFEEKWQPLLPYLSYIKVEVPTIEWDSCAQKLQNLKKQQIKILAEKVETEEEFEKLKALDFDFFQGFYFSRPKIIEAKTIQENEIIILRLLARLNDPEITVEELDHLIEQDPALSYKILRYINSAAVGLQRKVESIKQAVIYMGLRRIKAWASLLAISGIKEGNKDMIINALVRAYMCQKLITHSGSGNPDTAFTVGTLSILDALMQAPMHKLLENLPLSDEITDALLKREGILGEALNCALAYELLNFDQASFSGCDADCLNEAYLNSSHEAFRSAMGMED